MRGWLYPMDGAHPLVRQENGRRKGREGRKLPAPQEPIGVTLAEIAEIPSSVT
jgi:hypothetical protein